MAISQKAWIGARVVEERERRGWTQKELAEHAGLAGNTVVAIENGRSYRAGSLAAVRETLGLDLSRYDDDPLAETASEAVLNFMQAADSVQDRRSRLAHLMGAISMSGDIASDVAHRVNAMVAHLGLTFDAKGPEMIGVDDRGLEQVAYYPARDAGWIYEGDLRRQCDSLADLEAAAASAKPIQRRPDRDGPHPRGLPHEPPHGQRGGIR